MPSLREPLEHVTTCYKAFGEAFCSLVHAAGVVEGLVEAVEPEDTELAEATAEIGRLKALISDLTAGITMCRADAEIGRLVQGMPLGTQLRRDWASLDGTHIWMAFRWEGEPEDWHLVRVSKNDPAEALRAIQQKKE